jgi:hypothetical protein
MFARSYFGARYFPPVYFPQSDGDEPAPTMRQQSPAVCGIVTRTGTWGY